jgi:PHD/YefM family antitoxin component YafN of YafNO toxin-antitoxin module
MTIKSIGSTEAQNNFGRVLDDVTLNRARYIVKRRGVPQVIILSFDDFDYVLRDDSERRRMGSVLRDLRPQYRIGEVIEPAGDLE